MMWNPLLTSKVSFTRGCRILVGRQRQLGRQRLLTTSSSVAVQQKDSFQYHTALLWLAGSSAFLWISSSLSLKPTLCETAIEKSESSTEQQQQQREEAQDESTFPVYENVPDEDYPTDCFLCRTHRQGPCRPQWRSFEYCAKDNPTEEGAARCSIYVKAFQECWMKHLNLYLLIAMTLNQERIGDVERDFTQPEQRQADLQANFVWQEWNTLLEQEGFLDSCDRVKEVFADYDKAVPVWKVYYTLNEDPFVVNIPAYVPTRRPDGRVLKMAYGLDQENRAIGLADYDPQYEITKAESEGREPELEYHRIMLSLVPGITEAVQIKAVYAASDGMDDDPEEEDGVATEDLDQAIVGEGEDKGAVLTETGWTPLPGLKTPDGISYT
eukprot:scaffold1149_cov165-Amphora_coffeaeformis.AAC.5